MTAYVARDPFARGCYRRESAGRRSCSWCGRRRRVAFTYVWKSDDGGWAGRADSRYAFCGLPCFRLFNR